MPDTSSIHLEPTLWQIRPMTAADLPAVLSIERQCQPDPWSEAMFLAELENPCASVDLCAGEEGRVVGFLCSWLIRGELSILNLATAPQQQRQGIAARLLQHCLQRAEGLGLERAWLEVRDGNRPALALYQRFGFTAAGRRKKYYADGEDALVLQRGWP